MRESITTTRAATAADTEAFGAALADALPYPRAGPAVLYLSGGLGAGKTTLARGLLRRRGFIGPVRSPTFALLECYELGDLVVAHVDLYRLEEPRELEGLGLRDLAHPGHLWLVEWPERGAGHLPPPDLRVALELLATEEGRAITVAGESPLGVAWLAGVGAIQAGS
ncbi:MAG: tRNA (adenosine(37)-N6)-threonylcarbamoyltransferase complex ATPase subunit type 1 TsaE [Steroidobacteraceae bacterium]